MNVLVSGASGLVGTALVPQLEAHGHTVFALVRRQPTSDREIFWQPAENTIDASALEPIDGVIHLAGENIAGGRWNDTRKKRIRQSRTQGTRLLCDALANAASPPSGAGIGFGHGLLWRPGQ